MGLFNHAGPGVASILEWAATRGPRGKGQLQKTRLGLPRGNRHPASVEAALPEGGGKWKRHKGCIRRHFMGKEEMVGPKEFFPGTHSKKPPPVERRAPVAEIGVRIRTGSLAVGEGAITEERSSTYGEVAPVTVKWYQE